MYNDVDELESESIGVDVKNLYELSKKRICIDFMKHLTLDQLEELEKNALTITKEKKQAYSMSSLRDIE